MSTPEWNERCSCGRKIHHPNGTLCMHCIRLLMEYIETVILLAAFVDSGHPEWEKYVNYAHNLVCSCRAVIDREYQRSSRALRDAVVVAGGGRITGISATTRRVIKIYSNEQHKISDMVFAEFPEFAFIRDATDEVEDLLDRSDEDDDDSDEEDSDDCDCECYDEDGDDYDNEDMGEHDDENIDENMESDV
ncbi:hypothetical protein V3C99_017875 [Haemonchus contortus]